MTPTFSYLDTYVQMCLQWMSQHTWKGLHIQPPTEDRNVWRVRTTGGGSAGSREAPTLGYALSILMYEKFSLYAMCDINDEGHVIRLARTACEVPSRGISLAYANDLYTVITGQALTSRPDFQEAIQMAYEKECETLSRTRYPNDCCPLD